MRKQVGRDYFEYMDKSINGYYYPVLKSSGLTNIVCGSCEQEAAVDMDIDHRENCPNKDNYNNNRVNFRCI